MLYCYNSWIGVNQLRFESGGTRSKKRHEELKRLMKDGQTRRVVVGIWGDVLRSDIPLAEALIAAKYKRIAIVSIAFPNGPWDIRSAKVHSANYPFRWSGGRNAQRLRRKLKSSGR